LLDVILKPRISLANERPLLGIRVYGAFVVLRQLATGDIHFIKKPVLLSAYAHDPDTPVGIVSFQFLQIAVLAQGVIQDGRDAHRPATLSAGNALPGSLFSWMNQNAPCGEGLWKDPFII